MGKSETKAYLEAWAKTSGKPVEEILAEIGSTFDYQKNSVPIPTGEPKMSPVMEAIIAASGKGEKLDSKAMFESMMTLKMMEMMGAPRQQDSGGQSINELITKNNETWERRLEEMKQEQKEANLQRQLDDMKTLILSSGSKKDELSDKFEKLTEKLDEEKEKRFSDAIENKSAEISQLREDMAANLEEIRNREPNKTPREMLLDALDEQRRFDEQFTRWGKDHGWSNEKINRELDKEKPLKQKALDDIIGRDGLAGRLIDAWSGKTAEDEELEEPEVAEEPEKESAAEKAARKKGEIPAEPAPAPEEVLNIS